MKIVRNTWLFLAVLVALFVLFLAFLVIRIFVPHDWGTNDPRKYHRSSA